jgi:hypothetical protein
MVFYFVIILHVQNYMDWTLTCFQSGFRTQNCRRGRRETGRLTTGIEGGMDGQRAHVTELGDRRDGDLRERTAAVRRRDAGGRGASAATARRDWDDLGQAGGEREGAG